jgi:serine/threonine protein kinase
MEKTVAPGRGGTGMSEEFARRYKLRKRIAIGGTAEVFHADFIADGVQQPVVVKRVLPQFARDERFRRLFHEEACVAATVSHPNIVRVLDHGQLEQTCYIALERVEGRDLGSLLSVARATGRLPSANLAAYVAARVGEALQFIHEKTSSEGTPLKIIHRDVSPQNILVSFQGDVKLTDFGIAKSIIRQETTVDGTLRGKLDYMAPEQASLTEVDHRADLFALGCVLYEMLQGAPPFRGENELETLDRIRSNRITTEVEELPAPEPLRRVLERALQPEREARYQQAALMVADLQAFTDEQPEPPLSTELKRWVTELSSEQTSTSSTDAVDHAVQKLLGHGIEQSKAPRPPTPTAVFASSARAGVREARPTAEITTPSVRSRKGFHVAMAVVAILGICGWLLWAMRYFNTDDPQRAASQGELGPVSAIADSSPGSADSSPGSADSSPASADLSVASSSPGRRSPPRKGTSSRRSTASRRGSGHLTINSLPWSKVKIDGIYVGNTPLIKMQIPAGRHRVELMGPDSKVRKSFTVTLPRGRGRSYTFDFTR